MVEVLFVVMLRVLAIGVPRISAGGMVLRVQMTEPDAFGKAKTNNVTATTYINANGNPIGKTDWLRVLPLTPAISALKNSCIMPRWDHGPVAKRQPLARLARARYPKLHSGGISGPD